MTGHDHDIDLCIQSTHQRIHVLIPWHVNGTLDGHERAAVETYLATCQACQEEATKCRDLAEGMQAMEEVAWSPSPQRLSRLLSRIDAAEARPSWASRGRRYLYDYWHEGRLWWRHTPVFVRGALAAQGALLFLLVSTLALQVVMTPAGLYRTLSDSSISAPRESRHMRVLFSDELSVREMRQILGESGARVVNGPSPLGVYTVDVPSMTGSPDHLSLVLNDMRAHPKVRLAEPVLAE